MATAASTGVTTARPYTRASPVLPKKLFSGLIPSTKIWGLSGLPKCGPSIKIKSLHDLPRSGCQDEV